MYNRLSKFHERPEPFSRYTTDLLWTDPHIAAEMLVNHLDPATDYASRRAESIDKTISWMDQRFGFKDKSVCDLGCGPGLYATRMARLGACASGVDFSSTSLDYAKAAALEQGLMIDYRQADYLSGELPKEQDIVTLIYGDLCTLAPVQRRKLYARVQEMLKSGGHFVFDVFPVEQFSLLQEKTIHEHRLMNGFWSSSDYFGFIDTVLYEDQKISLDHYLIVQQDRCLDVYNWMQYFDPQSISAELRDAGFEITDIVDVVTGELWVSGPRELAVLARKP